MPRDPILEFRPRAAFAAWLPAWVGLVLAMLAPSARAADPGVHSDIVNGVARVMLDGSFAGSRYTALRAEGANQPYRVLGERDALCTGDCYVIDRDALVGATYWYRFDLVTGDGTQRTYGPYPVTVGGAAASGLSASPSPNPLRDRGSLRVTAAIPAGDRALSQSRATGLPGEVTLVDMGGRVVRTLWRGTLDRLTFDVPFVARDAHGQALPPGLYFVVVRAGQHRSISRVAVLK